MQASLARIGTAQSSGHGDAEARIAASASPSREGMAGASDIIPLGVIFGALILSVGVGGTTAIQTVRNLAFGEAPPDPALIALLVLNIALILYGTRRYVSLTRAVSTSRQAEQTAQRLAETDSLTGCLNRRTFAPALRSALEDARGSGGRIAVMMVDVDRFKRINDVHGHRCGDTVLVEVAARIRRNLPANAELARLGGDEFACIVRYEPGQAAAIDAMAAAIVAELATPITFNGTQVEAGASVGIASDADVIVTLLEDVVDDLLHQADQAMYHAKRNGRGRYAWFEAGMARASRYRSELEREIREGIERGEFVPFYEKQVDLESGEITGFEMLARWHSPRHGLLSPDAFIRVAEEIGVIDKLSEALISQALHDAASWDQGLTLSVNISPVQLRDPWFAQRLLKLLVEARFPPQRLEIEITEACLHENPGVVRSLVASLRNQGVRISLDDFGTGYNSLSQLNAIEFDRIKIDRSFVATLGQSAKSQTIVSAISSMGEGMGLPVTAEGIETPQMLETLRAIGSFKGQGYLYGRPGDASTVLRWLAEERDKRGAQPVATAHIG